MIDYKDEIQFIIEFPRKKIHDYELMNNIIAAIGENETWLIDIQTKRKWKYYPQKEYSFLRGKFMIKKNNVLFYLLSGNKMDECKVIIEKHYEKSSRD